MAHWWELNLGSVPGPPDPGPGPDPEPEPPFKTIDARSWDLPAVDGWYDSQVVVAVDGKQIISRSWSLVPEGGWYDTTPTPQTSSRRELTMGIDEPIRRAAYCTTDWRNVFSAPVRGKFMRHARFVWHQGIGAEQASQRQDTWNRLRAWRAEAQSDALLMLHKLPEYCKINKPTESDGKKYLYKAVWSQGPDEFFLLNNGGFLMAEGTAAVAVRYPQAVTDAVAKEFWEDWGDRDGSRTGELDMVSYVDDLSVNALYIYDSIPAWQVDRYGQELHRGAVITKNANGQLTIPYWAGFVEAGAPDGSGFYSDWSAYDGEQPVLWGRDSGRTTSFGGKVTGVKHNGTSSTTIRYAIGSDSYYGAVGDDIVIFNGDRVGYSGDWNLDGTSEDRNTANAIFRANDVLRMHLSWVEEFRKIAGYECPTAGNMGNAHGLMYLTGVAQAGMASSNPFIGAIDIPSNENFLQAVGVNQWDGTGFELRGLYTEDRFATYVEGTRMCIDTSVDHSAQANTLEGSSRLCDGSAVLTYELGGVTIPNTGTDESQYVTFSQNKQFASLARTAAAFQLALKNTAACISGERLNRHPWGVQDWYFWPGFPLDNAKRQIFTMNTDTGVITWDTPDFGTHGYVIPFEGALVVANFKDPGSGYLPVNDGTVGDLVTVGGQDLETWAQAQFGKSVYFIDGFNYQCRHTTGPLAGFYPGRDPHVIRDNDFNDGSKVSTKFPGGLRCNGFGGYILELK